MTDFENLSLLRIKTNFAVGLLQNGISHQTSCKRRGTLASSRARWQILVRASHMSGQYIKYST